mgnify:CR=1 FL=1
MTVGCQEAIDSQKSFNPLFSGEGSVTATSPGTPWVLLVFQSPLQRGGVCDRSGCPCPGNPHSGFNPLFSGEGSVTERTLCQPCGARGCFNPLFSGEGSVTNKGNYHD